MLWEMLKRKAEEMWRLTRGLWCPEKKGCYMNSGKHNQKRPQAGSLRALSSKQIRTPGKLKRRAGQPKEHALNRATTSKAHEKARKPAGRQQGQTRREK